MARARWLSGSVACVLVSALAAAPLAAQPAREDQDRLTVIRVELAWLGDPELCCYYPCARVEGGQVHVGGYLPSTALRDKALKIALMVANLPAVDEMKVHPGCRFAHVQTSSDVVMQSAAQTLKLRFPDEYRHWQLGLRGPGEVVIAGPINSQEKKLLVSQKLRGLPGCRCVVNQLQVAQMQTKSQPPAVKPAAPGLAKTAVPAPAAPAKTATVEPVPKSVPVAVPQQGVALGPKVQPLPPLPPPIKNPTMTTPSAMAHVQPAKQPAKTGTVPSGQTVLLSPMPTQTGHPNPPSIAASYDVKPQPGTSDYKQLPTGTPLANKQVPGSASPGHVAAYHGDTDSNPTVWQSTTPAPHFKPVPASAKAPTAPVAKNPVMPGHVSLSPPVPSSKTPLAKPATSPVVNQMVAGEPSLAEVRELIQKTAGSSLTNLEVNRTGSKLAVRFAARNEEEADRLANLVMTTPGLEMYRLELKVDVPR